MFSHKYQLFFAFIFGLYLLLSLLLGETFFGLYLHGFFALVLIIVHLLDSMKRRSGAQLPSLVCIGWIFYFMTFLLSMLFTHSLPLSINSLVVLSISFIWFHMFFERNGKRVREGVSFIVLMVGSVLIVLSWIFSFFPDWAGLLPGMNILHATYGHNHLASFIILTLPLHLWFMFTFWQQRKLSTKWLLFLVAVPIFALITSFGRVATLIGLGEVIVWYVIYKRELSRSYLVTTFFKGILAVFIVVISLKFLLAVIPFQSSTFRCPFPHFELQLCKPLNRENRPYYWLQAVKGATAYPVFGYGPGTFLLINKIYKQTPTTSTGYAHNAFLQQFAELGLIGGIAFLFLMMSLLYTAWKKLKSRPKSMEFAVLMGVVATYVNVLFDYDWSFTGLYVLTMVFLALIIPNEEALIYRKRFLNRAIFLLRNVSFMIVILLFGLYGAVEFLISQHKYDQAVELFPYFSWHSPVFNIAPISQSSYKTLQRIHRYNSEAFSHKEKDGSVTLEKAVLLSSLDPWKAVYMNFPQHFIQRSQWEEAEMVAVIGAEFIQKNNAKEYLSPAIKAQWSQALWTLVHHNFSSNSFKEAHSLADLAIYIDPWLLQNGSPLVFDHLSLIDSYTFHHEVLLPNKDFIGTQRAYYSRQYLTMLQKSVEMSSSVEDTFRIAQAVIELEPFRANEVWKELSLHLNNQVEQDLKTGNVKMAQENVEAWWKALQMLESSQYAVDYEWKAELARKLQVVGNESVSHSLFVVGDNYVKAATINPYSLQKNTFWLQEDAFLASDKNEVDAFLKQTYGTVVQSSHKAYFSKAYMSSILRDLKEGSPDGVQEKIQQYLTLESPSSGYVVEFQLLADTFVAGGKYDKALETLEAAQSLMPDDYWMSTQVGNMYAKVQEKIGSDWQREATESWTKCHQRFEGTHTDCDILLSEASEQRFNSKRYDEVSLIIQGKKKWQDFISKSEE